ncbi:MAG: hypothetical protein HOQ36_11570 [Nocardia sp.]|nr:hypothetical protein [Nocardia sp.]
MGAAITGGSDTAMKAMWQDGGVAEPARTWLDRHGWDAEVFDTYERAAAYGRELPPLGDSPMDRFSDAARNGLVVARRR